MQLFVEDYCSGISEPIQTRMRANQERRWRKILDDTLINLRDHTCRFTQPVITFQQIHLGLVSPSNCLVDRRHAMSRKSTATFEVRIRVLFGLPLFLSAASGPCVSPALGSS